VPPAMNVVAVLGGVELDFREAVLPGGEITISAVCLLGGLNITVPPEMQVIDTGVALLGGREIDGDGDEPVRPGAPVLRISGFCFLGGVEVKRKARKGQGRAGGRRGIPG
jgi:Cell wall-active antibiotics response 4TMS YvqF